MKICYVTNLYGGNARGGAERVVLAEAKAVAAAGHDVLIVAGVAEGERPDGEGRVVRVTPPNLYFYSEAHGHSWPIRLVWHVFDIFNFRSAGLIREVLENEKPDVVHTHNLMGLGFLIPRMIRGLKIRHVHTVHDVQLLHPSGLIRGSGREPGLAARIYIALMRSLMGSPDVVVFPSRFLLELHGHHGFFFGSRQEVIPTPAPEVALRARAVPRNGNFSFIGQLESHKGVLDLIEAWAGWEGRGSAELVIAGDGSLSDEIVRRAAAVPGVRPTGKLDAEAVAELIDQSAFTVVPSLVIENAPAVIMESLSRGTPVIAADVGGIPEFVREGQNGFLFATGDKEALRAAFERARQAVPEWRRLFENACRSVKEFGPESHAAKLIGIYTK